MGERAASAPCTACAPISARPAQVGAQQPGVGIGVLQLRDLLLQTVGLGQEAGYSRRLKYSRSRSRRAFTSCGYFAQVLGQQRRRLPGSPPPAEQGHLQPVQVRGSGPEAWEAIGRKPASPAASSSPRRKRRRPAVGGLRRIRFLRIARQVSARTGQAAAAKLSCRRRISPRRSRPARPWGDPRSRYSSSKAAAEPGSPRRRRISARYIGARYPAGSVSPAGSRPGPGSITPSSSNPCVRSRCRSGSTGRPARRPCRRKRPSASRIKACSWSRSPSGCTPMNRRR